MRIALITDGLATGGAERQTVVMAAELTRRGEDVTLISYGLRNDFEDYLNRNNVPVVCVSGRGPLRLGRLVEMARVLRRGRFDVVHCVKGNASIWGRLAAKLAGSPCVFGGYRINQGCEMMSRPLQKALSLRTAGWIVNGKDVKRYIVETLGLDPSRVYVVSNGLLSENYTSALTRQVAREKFSLSPDVLAVTMIAQLRIEKNHAMLMRVAAEVLATHPGRVMFLLAGEGPYKAAVESMISQAGLGESVRLLGRCSPVADLLKASDVVVHTSNNEGLPNALLEAAGAGLAVVCTKAGDSDSVVRDGQNGYLVNLDDSATMAQRLLQLLGDPDLRGRMGQEGAAHVRAHFSVEAMGNCLLDTYRRGQQGLAAG